VRSILIVERSATLRHALLRRLTAQQYRAFTAPDYATAHALLGDPNWRGGLDAIVLGLPLDHSGDFGELLGALNAPEHRDLAVLVLAHAAEPAIHEWVARRARAALHAWDHHAELAQALTQLLSHAPSARPTSETRHDIRVLLVDDARTVRAVYRRLLVAHGYAVETAANVEEAFAKAIESPFDIAIVDYFMPGANGDVLCRRLREDPRTAGITAAILTGTYSDQVVRSSLEAGAIECMFKNEPDELFLARIAAMGRAVRITKSIDAERQRLAGILGSVGDGVYGVDSDGRVTFMNPAARRILCLGEDESWVGRLAHETFHYAHENGRPNPPETCFLQQAYAAGDELHGWQTVFFRRDGVAVPVECTVFPFKVAGRLEGSVVAFRDVSERLRLERELTWQATHDPLTHLPNRRHFERELGHEVSRLARSDDAGALLYLDLDRFKYINDTAGHAAGDQLLIEIARELRARMRDTDLLARLGGDEFALIARNVTRDAAMAVAESFREILDHYTFVYEGRHYKIGGSIGVAMIGRASGSPGEVLANADIACHIAKSRGRNQTHLYQAESDEKVVMYQELGWSTRLQEALHGDGFTLYYQPIVRVDGGAHAAHYEVLVRYLGSRGEVIAPGAFLSTAERFGLMPQLDGWVLRHAISKLGELQRMQRPATFTVNISGQTLDTDNLRAQLIEWLREHRVDPSSLILEITETSAIANLEGARKLIRELKELGCRFALDDFGSGFSSFHHLKHLPVDYVKIDGQFVQAVATSVTDRAIVASINEIAHAFGKHTVAEYVEDARILEVLRHCGVDFAQGYYISEPKPDLAWPEARSRSC
jgi:diguanylate cyclase (GGDEF)-like protein/PAS domain S-box-containing protein